MEQNQSKFQRRRACRRKLKSLSTTPTKTSSTFYSQDIAINSNNNENEIRDHEIKDDIDGVCGSKISSRSRIYSLTSPVGLTSSSPLLSQSSSSNSSTITLTSFKNSVEGATNINISHKKPMDLQLPLTSPSSSSAEEEVATTSDTRELENYLENNFSKNREKFSYKNELLKVIKKQQQQQQQQKKIASSSSYVQKLTIKFEKLALANSGDNTSNYNNNFTKKSNKNNKSIKSNTSFTTTDTNVNLSNSVISRSVINKNHMKLNKNFSGMCNNFVSHSHSHSHEQHRRRRNSDSSYYKIFSRHRNYHKQISARCRRNRSLKNYDKNNENKNNKINYNLDDEMSRKLSKFLSSLKSSKTQDTLSTNEKKNDNTSKFYCSYFDDEKTNTATATATTPTLSSKLESSSSSSSEAAVVVDVEHNNNNNTKICATTSICSCSNCSFNENITRRTISNLNFVKNINNQIKNHHSKEKEDKFSSSLSLILPPSSSTSSLSSTATISSFHSTSDAYYYDNCIGESSTDDLEFSNTKSNMNSDKKINEEFLDHNSNNDDASTSITDTNSDIGKNLNSRKSDPIFSLNSNSSNIDRCEATNRPLISKSISCYPADTDSNSDSESICSTLKLSLVYELKELPPIIEELIRTEEKYIKNLKIGIRNYGKNIFNNDDNMKPLPDGLKGKKWVVLGNIEQIYEFHSTEFLPMLLKNQFNLKNLFDEFLKFIDENCFYSYVLYTMNKKNSTKLCEEYRDFFKNVQDQIDDKLGINSFLVQPIQRLARYPLLLEQLITTCFKTNNIKYKPVIEACCKVEKRIRKLLITTNEAEEINDIEECFDINIYLQGKFKKMNEFSIYDYTQRRNYRSKVFIFDKCLIYTEIRDKI